MTLRTDKKTMDCLSEIRKLLSKFDVSEEKLNQKKILVYERYKQNRFPLQKETK